jgi:hypothetical protein
LSKNLIFTLSFIANPVLEEDLNHLGWTEQWSGKRRKTLLKSAKKELSKKLEASRPIDSYRFRFKEVPIDSQECIEENLSLLKLSKKNELRVDKFLARNLGYSHLLAGKNLDSSVMLYVTSANSTLVYLKSFFGRTLIKRLTRVVRFSGVVKCLGNSSGTFSLKKRNFSNTSIIRPCLISFSESKNYLINSEPSMDAISQRLGLKQDILLKNKSTARLPHFEQVKLERAFYPFSRKDELFFHALHWTLPKAMIAINDMQSEDNSILLINEKLNITIKDNLLDYAKTKLPVDRIKFIDYKSSVYVSNLSLYSTEYQNQHGIFVYQNNSELNESLNLMLSYRDHEPYTLQSNRILLFRESKSRKSSDRNLENWSEVQELFLKRGFTLIDLGKLSLFQQMQIYKEAEIVIGLHGGHFSQMFCARSSTIIVEIFSGLYSSCFQDMAKQYKLEYHSLSATKQKNGWYLDSKRALQVIETLSL